MNLIGIKLADGTFYPIMEDGTPQKTTLDLTTVKDNQTIVQVDLYRSKTGTMENAEYIDSLEIKNLVRHPNGQPDISLNLNLDENDHLEAEINDPETGGHSGTTVTLVSRTLEERENPTNFELNIPDTENSVKSDGSDTEEKNDKIKKAGVGLLGLAAGIAAGETASDIEKPDTPETELTLDELDEITDISDDDTSISLDELESIEDEESVQDETVVSGEKETAIPGSDDIEPIPADAEDTNKTDIPDLNDIEASTDEPVNTESNIPDFDDAEIVLPEPEETETISESENFESSDAEEAEISVPKFEPENEDTEEPVVPESEPDAVDTDTTVDPNDIPFGFDTVDTSSNSEESVEQAPEEESSTGEAPEKLPPLTDDSEFIFPEFEDLDGTVSDEEKEESDQEEIDDTKTNDTENLDIVPDTGTTENTDTIIAADTAENSDDVPETDEYVDTLSFANKAIESTEENPDETGSENDTTNTVPEDDSSFDDLDIPDLSSSEEGLEDSNENPQKEDLFSFDEPSEDSSSNPDNDSAADTTDKTNDSTDSFAAVSQPLDFSDLYDKETKEGHTAAQFEGENTNEIKKKTRVPVLICIICAIICIIATALVLFVVPSKINLIDSRNTKERPPVVEEQKPETPAPEIANPVAPEPEENKIVVTEPETVVPKVPEQKSEENPEIIRYKIKWGDTLWDIADAYYRNPWRYKEIAQYNKIRDPDYIISGTYIEIPEK